MGIPGLTSFLKEKFKHWKCTRFEDWDYVVIDGNNICFELYFNLFPWTLGGEYKKYSSKVEEVFCTIKSGVKNPIIVFDTKEKATFDVNLVKQRRIESWKEMGELQSKEEWNPHDMVKSKSITPLMITATFFDVIQRLNIDIYYANGEADREIAALANQYKCPVISSDSDFFIFNLTGGLIHFGRHFCDGSTDSLYDIIKLQEQFDLKEYELCLVIPATVKASPDTACYGHTVFYEYDDLLHTLGTYHNCEEYFHACSTESKHQFDMAKKFYCNLSVSKESVGASGDLDFEHGQFPLNMILAYKHKLNILPRVVEDINRKSVWHISRFIRHYIYGLMKISADSQLTEVSRKDCLIEIDNRGVSPKKLKVLPLGYGKNKEILQDKVLTVLKCRDLISRAHDLFSKQEDRWKLPIAATFYWYSKVKQDDSVKMGLVKSLLLSFLFCSGHGNHTIKKLLVSKETKSCHLRALHTFSQWKCVYHDAIALNYLSEKPFPATSLAELYSGEVVMYYASVNIGANLLLQKGSTERVLFNELLFLVTVENGDNYGSWTVVRGHCK